ncbi:class I SAM-dependent methyltransferase [Ramlibacter sp. AN1015]|uniref:class I SAM-dependent methyltransferase n=1 Tax=Ramlibacter sp. AN1015 TaxID=3133428 RepID=UPI0030C1F65B
MNRSEASGSYVLGSDGIFRPPFQVQHRDEEFQESSFDVLLAMQERHFWYRGRHRFLLGALDRFRAVASDPDVIDLGGGCGGWIRYLSQHRGSWASTLALADSSPVALHAAASVLPSSVQRYQVDLMDLRWDGRWDVAFLLDVIEHLPDDLCALQQARRALRPGGLLLVTVPAFPAFWSYNDELALHLRRYTRADFLRLAEAADFELCDARYFMFLLSPLYLLARHRPGIARMSEEQKRKLFVRSHRTPAAPVNEALSAVFAAETPFGHKVRFPWGTSMLGVFRKAG